MVELRCGKVIGKDKEQLTQAQIDAQRNIKCYRLVYGLVSMDATTPTGEPTKVDIYLYCLELQVQTLPSYWRALKSLKGRESLMQNHVLNLTQKEKRKAGSNVYYVSEVNIDTKKGSFYSKRFRTYGYV